MSADLVAGNTRLRARRPALLTAAHYGRLIGCDVRGVADVLLHTAYRPHLDQALSHAGDPAALRGAVGARLREVLRHVVRAYPESARPVVELLPARHDLADVVTLARGAVTRVPADEVLAAVFAVGRVDPQRARDVAAAADADAAVARCLAWRLPDQHTADQLPELWRRFELHEDLAELETDLAGAAHQGWLAVLAAAGRAARPIAELLADERDTANLLAALRLRARGDDQPLRWLPAGHLPSDALAAVAAGDDPAPAVPRRWRAAVERWHRHGELGQLERELVASRQRTAIAGSLSAEGSAVRTAEDGQATQRAVTEQLTADGGGVVAVHGALWAAVPTAVRDAWRRGAQTLFVPLPSDDVAGSVDHPAALHRLLAAAVGYEITFSTEERPT